MNVSLPGPMEKFIRQKVKVGDYETASEVVREGLRLLQQRDEVWKKQIRDGIEEGYESVRLHGTLTEEEVDAEMRAWKKKQRKSAAAK
jgi:antitoxin ParD1/3/4